MKNPVSQLKRDFSVIEWLVMVLSLFSESADYKNNKCDYGNNDKYANANAKIKNSFYNFTA